MKWRNARDPKQVALIVSKETGLRDIGPIFHRVKVFMKHFGVTAIALSAALLFSASLIAQQRGDQDKQVRAGHRYKLLDLGTLGGPISYGSASGDGARLLNDKGEVASYADTSLPDPFAPNGCFDTDCFLAHAFRWGHGKITDLGGLNDGFNSLGDSINDKGWVTGFAQTGLSDPSFIFPLADAVLWKGRRAIDLGRLPGGSFSLGIVVNNAGQVAGFSDNGVPDPFGSFFFPSPNQVRTFLWRDGELRDIGTLGGPDAILGPGCNNQSPGVIVGSSYINFTPNASSGQPTIDPFLWDNGTMTDLGNLGGTFNFGQCVNNRGEVIGNSNLPDDQTFHAYRWRNGKMKDLGTLGGPDSEAVWINDIGDIAGSADLRTPGIHDAVIWRHGQIQDLGTLPGDACSRGRAINSRGQVVGGSSDCTNFLHAFVWEKGRPMLDLNKLIRPGSGLQLTNAININDRGEILAKSFPIGTTPNDDEDLGHLVLLIPCEEEKHEVECSDDESRDEYAGVLPVSSSAATRLAIIPHSKYSLTAEDGAAPWRVKLARRKGVPNSTAH